MSQSSAVSETASASPAEPALALIPRNITSSTVWTEVPLSSLTTLFSFVLSWVAPLRLEPLLTERYPSLRSSSLWDLAVEIMLVFPPPSNHSHFRRVHLQTPPSAPLITRHVASALAARVEAFARDGDLAVELARVRSVAGGVRRECGVCGDEFGEEGMVSCADGGEDCEEVGERHRICRPCFARYVQSTVIEHMGVCDLAKVRCVHSSEPVSCERNFAEAVVRANVSSYAQFLADEKLQDIIRWQVVSSVGEDHVLDCSKCGSFMVVEEKAEKPVVCQAEGCHELYCGFLCGVEPHPGRPCPPKTAPVWLAAMVTGEAESSFCPNCGVPITRNGGCARMICSNCSTQFCILCGRGYEGVSHANCQRRAHRQRARHEREQERELLDEVWQRARRGGHLDARVDRDWLRYPVVPRPHRAA